jgi:hypothetical protein
VAELLLNIFLERLECYVPPHPAWLPAVAGGRLGFRGA